MWDRLKMKLTAGLPGCGRRLISFVLALAFVFQLAPLASADDPVNTLILRVETGLNTGENVKYFTVNYLGTDGKSYSEFVLTNDSALDLSATIANVNKVDEYHYRAFMFNQYSPYHVEPRRDYGCLGPYSTNEFLLQLEHPFQKLQSVDVFTEKGSKRWECRGIEVFAVAGDTASLPCGYISDDFYIPFTGSLVGQTDMTESVGIGNSGGAKVTRFTPKGEGANRASTDLNVWNVGEKPYSQGSAAGNQYMFQIKIADFSKAGIEAFNSEECVLDMMEALVLEAVYTDTVGRERRVYMPVLTSCLAWADAGTFGAYGDVMRNTNAVAQQGDSLVFAGDLPGFAALKQFTLYYGDQYETSSSAVWRAGCHTPFVEVGNAHSRHVSKLKEKLVNDSLHITGMGMYAINGTAANSVYYDPTCGTLNLTPTGNCLYYYAAKNATGDMLNYGSNMRKDMTVYTPDAQLTPVDTSKNYILAITTDTVPGAGTVEDLDITLKYVGTDGLDHTKSFRMSDSVADFYGYWWGKQNESDETVDPYSTMALLFGTRPGAELDFFLSMESVAEIKSVNFKMGAGADDDWQIKSVVLYQPEWYSNRQVSWSGESVFPYNVMYDNPLAIGTYCTITRNFDREHIISAYVGDEDDPYNPPIYINPEEEEREADFGDDDPGSSGNSDPWQPKYSISYKEALQDFGFSKSRVTYEVEVKVDSNENAAGDDDCGSNNKFYFQLVFENGTSAYVLANQQLMSDGFRSGELETFYISTNQNYGDLKMIRIVPDDVSENDNSSVYDKLNIKKITVSKMSTTGVAPSWEFDDPGWIEIDYNDEGARNTATGQAGRGESELAREFSVTGKGSTNTLLVTLATGYDDEGDYIYDGRELFGGTLTAEIRYWDLDSKLQTKTIDVIRNIYAYRGQSPARSDTAFTDDDGTATTLAESNNEMFTGGVDRFNINLNNLHHIESMTLFATPRQDYHWIIDDISVFQIMSDGALMRLANGEYKRSNAVEFLCKATEDSYTLDLKGSTGSAKYGQTRTLDDIVFTSHSISLNGEGDEWKASITREPIGDHDTLNVYAYTGETGSSDISAVVGYYNGVEDAPYQAAFGQLTPDINGMYHAETEVSNLSSITGLTLSSAGGASVSYAVVQQVRAGVVIRTLYYDVGEIKPGETVDGKIADSSKYAKQSKQVVKLFFSEKTEAAKLAPEVNDLAIGIRYTASDGTNGTFNSRFAYLTDVLNENGTRKYNEIRPGMVAEIPFNESCVASIDGILLGTMGNIKADVECAAVGIYETTNLGETCTAWYNFAEMNEIDSAPHVSEPSEENVAPIKLTLQTAKSTEEYSSGTNAPIRMTITYTDPDMEELQTATYRNIRQYLSSGSFDAGETATVELFLTNVGSIRSITLEPVEDDAYEMGSWRLSELVLESTVDGTVKKVDRSIEETIKEGTPKEIPLVNMIINLRVTAYDSLGNATVLDTTKGDAPNITIESGKSVMIQPDIVGSLPGFGSFVKAERVASNDARADAPYYSIVDGQVEFTPPENTTDNDIMYEITISSEEIQSIKQVVRVVVQPAPPAEEPEEPEFFDEDEEEDVEEDIDIPGGGEDIPGGEEEDVPGGGDSGGGRRREDEDGPDEGGAVG